MGRCWGHGLRALVVAGVMLGGCTIDFGVGNENANGNTNQNANDNIGTSGQLVVRFRNYLTAEAVRTQFYASTEPLGTIPDDLFVEENLVTANIGLAGSGLLEPLSEDSIALTCTGDITVGTLGGEVLDPESGEVLGQGEMRWVEEAPLGLCGGVVTINYIQDEDGYDARITIE